MADTETKPGRDLVGGLTKAVGQYAVAKTSQKATNLGNKVGSAGSGTKSRDSGEDGDGEDKKGFLGATVEKLGEGASPVKAAVSGAATSVKEGVTGLFKRKGGSKRPHNIVEDIIVGVPPDVCWAAYTQWEEFPSFMKGPTNVNRGEETPEEELEEDQHPLEGEETNWNAKIFLSKRSWKATTVDYDPPNRLSWTSEGAKGTVDGTITFTPIGENATLMAVEIEYRSKGIVEWTGQRWHTVGKRVRLDMKHFRRYVMRTEPDELPEPEEPMDEPVDEGQELPEEGEETPDEGQEPDEVDEGEEPPVDETEGEQPEDSTEEDPAAEPASFRVPRSRQRAGAGV